VYQRRVTSPSHSPSGTCAVSSRAIGMRDRHCLSTPQNRGESHPRRGHDASSLRRSTPASRAARGDSYSNAYSTTSPLSQSTAYHDQRPGLNAGRTSTIKCRHAPVVRHQSIPRLSTIPSTRAHHVTAQLTHFNHSALGGQAAMGRIRTSSPPRPRGGVAPRTRVHQFELSSLSRAATC
jgi:hypothetical protein